MGQRKGGAGRGETGVLRDEREWSVVPLLQGQQGFAPPGIKKPLSNVFCSAAFVLPVRSVVEWEAFFRWYAGVRGGGRQVE